MKKLTPNTIYWVDFPDVSSSKKHITGKKRPCLYLSSEKGAIYSPVGSVIPISSATKKALPCHIDVDLKRPSVLLLEQITTVPIECIGAPITTAPDALMNKVKEGLIKQLGL